MRKGIIIVAAVIVIAVIGVAAIAARNQPQSTPPASTTPPASSTFSIGPGNYEYKITYQDQQRRYLLHVPPSYDMQSPVPLILNFHGDGSNADDAKVMTQMDSTSDKDGFIVAYPEGVGKAIRGKVSAVWSAGSDKTDIDDVGFTKQVINQIEENFNIDANRVYATGFSGGAEMSYSLACNLSSEIAAIAPVSRQDDDPAGCTLSRPVPIIHIHGTEDNCAPYNGGMCGACFSEYVKALFGINVKDTSKSCTSVQEGINKWVELNDVTPTPEVSFQKGSTTCVTYSGAGEIEFCTIEGGGHAWPGGVDLGCVNDPDSRQCSLYKEYIGTTTKDISANDVIWNFFQKHPLADS